MRTRMRMSTSPIVGTRVALFARVVVVVIAALADPADVAATTPRARAPARTTVFCRIVEVIAFFPAMRAKRVQTTQGTLRPVRDDSDGCFWRDIVGMSCCGAPERFGRSCARLRGSVLVLLKLSDFRLKRRPAAGAELLEACRFRLFQFLSNLGCARPRLA